MASNGQSGYVYLLRASTGVYKIGRSKDPAARMHNLAEGMPYDLELVHKIATNDPAWLERALHRKFRHRNVKGEWFALTDADVAKIVVTDHCERPGWVRFPKKRRHRRKRTIVADHSRPQGCPQDLLPTSASGEAAVLEAKGILAGRLQDLRQRANLSQPDLAKRAGISLSLLCKIEQGLTDNPRLNTLRGLATALRTTLVGLAGP